MLGAPGGAAPCPGWAPAGRRAQRGMGRLAAIRRAGARPSAEERRT